MKSALSARNALACSALAACLMAAPALAQWEPHLARLNSAIKCRAAVFGLDGVQWAGVAQIAPSREELKYLVAGFENPAGILAAGPKLLGRKYTVTRAESNLMLGKLKTEGFVAVKSAKAAALCVFNEADATPEKAIAAGQRFAGYLGSIGY